MKLYHQLYGRRINLVSDSKPHLALFA